MGGFQHHSVEGLPFFGYRRQVAASIQPTNQRIISGGERRRDQNGKEQLRSGEYMECMRRTINRHFVEEAVVKLRELR